MPYVTSVGATQLGSKNKLHETRSGAQPFGAKVCKDLFHPFEWKCADGSDKYEVTCSYANGALITSGGGFSVLFPQPAWQKAAVQAYLASSAQRPPAGAFNASNLAFPVISALGHNYLIRDSGSFEPVGKEDFHPQFFLCFLNNLRAFSDGTSASTPVIAALTSLWNSQRIAAGTVSKKR